MRSEGGTGGHATTREHAQRVQTGRAVSSGCERTMRGMDELAYPFVPALSLSRKAALRRAPDRAPDRGGLIEEQQSRRCCCFGSIGRASRASEETPGARPEHQPVRVRALLLLQSGSRGRLGTTCANASHNDAVVPVGKHRSRSDQRTRARRVAKVVQGGGRRLPGSSSIRPARAVPGATKRVSRRRTDLRAVSGSEILA
jgi:hypothetical protein